MLYTKNKTKVLTKKLKKEISYLGKEYRELIKNIAEKEPEYSELLLCDNYYLIEQTGKSAVQGIEQIKNERSDIGFEYPRVFCHLLEFTEGACAESFCDEAISDFLISKQSGDPYESAELYALGSMLSAAIVSKIYDRFRAGESIETYVKMLFLRKNIDFDEVFARTSKLESILLEDPSGVYARSDKETRAAYRQGICDGAKREKTSELEFASRLLSVAKNSKGEANSLGYYLVREKKSPFASLYFPMIAVMVCALLSVYFLIAGNVDLALCVAALFLLLPFFDVAKQIASMILSKLAKPKILPRLELDSIPDDMRTFCVVTTLLFGEKNDGAIFDRLEDFYNLSNSENLYFGVLGDLRDGSEANNLEDEKIIDYAKGRIDALNTKYGNKFLLLVRDRHYSICENKYMGWERKRGALIELVRLIGGKKTSISTAVGDVDALKGVKYVITLDSDTRLSHTSIKKLVGTAAHPQNRPKIEMTRSGAIVTEGYGIMQPRMISSLESVSKSYFSLMQCGSGGIEFYDTCDFNIYQQLFGEGIFCGKGIFDVDAFATIIDGAFPDESVLSHDLLEGTRLRAAYLGDISLVDSAPSSSMSYYDRLHRWIRGDVQSVAFCKAPINSLSKFKLIDNLLRALTPVSALAAIITGALAGGRYATLITLCAVLYLVLPALVSFLLPIVSRNVGAYKILIRSYFSYAIGGMVKDAVNTLYGISSLVYLSYVSLDAIIRAAWRTAFSRRHMLEWTTADESERKKNTPFAYFWRMQISVWVGLVVLVLTDEFFSDICALMFMLFPFVAYMLSKSIKTEKRSFAAHKKQLCEYARDTWRFFEDLVGEEDNYLPPDNYQILPIEAVAHRTSPTNIGMYLCAALSARDFGFIDSDELYTRLDRTLSTVEKMEKWHGHLYNWYDTRDLSLLLPSYVSTVDSGNFFCSLVALGKGILEYANENTALLEIAGRIDALVEAVDFSPLYNPKRKLFYIGLDTSSEKFDENYYDLYMSEARLASYFSVARSDVPDEHWKMLGRHFIGDGNHIGLASWSGTAFEYFMPALFLPVYSNSMAYEGLLFAFSINKKNAKQTRDDNGHTRHIWGKSESAFYSFDSEMNYRYRAIGESKLGLVMGLEEDRVFAPYALFLMLAASTRDVVAGLGAMKEIGAYGKYGFYESVDLTPSRVGGGRAIVKSHMSHHMGMSMVALANACFDDAFCRRFMSAPLMRASALLLCEKLPADAIIYNKKVRDVDKKSLQLIEKMRSRQSARQSEGTSTDALYADMVSDGRMRVVATSLGDVCFSLADKAITHSDPSFERAFSFLFEADSKVYRVLGQLSGENKIEKLNFACGSGELSYKISYHTDEKISATVDITLDSDRHMAIIAFGAEGRFSSICPGVIFEPVLCRPDDYRAHSSFSKLFVEAQFLPDEKILLYRKKGRAEKEKDIWLGLAFAEQGGELEYESKAQNILPEFFSSEDIEKVFAKKLDSSGDGALFACIDPICVMKRRSLSHGKYKCELLVALGDERADVVSNIIDARRKKNRFALGTRKSALYRDARQRLSGADRRSFEAAKKILASLVYKTNFGAPKENLCARPLSYGSLWKFGISGDEKLVVIDVTDGIGRAVTEMLVCAHKFLWLSGIRFELVFIYQGNNEYTNPQRSELERMILYSGSDEFIGKRAGIFICARYAMNQAEYELFENISSIFVKLSSSDGVESVLSLLERRIGNQKAPKLIRRRFESAPGFIPTEMSVMSVFGGEFRNDGFFVDKSCVRAPWSYVYCNCAFGTLLTQNSLGFTWYRNSREARISEWAPDPVGYRCTESISLLKDGILYDLVALSESVFYKRSHAEYKGNIFGAEYSVCVGCDPALAVKAISVKIDHRALADSKLVYSLSPVMGNIKKHENVIDLDASENGIQIRSLFGDRDFCAYIFASQGAKYENSNNSCSASFDLSDGGESFFLLGARPSFSLRSELYVREKISSTADVFDMFERYGKKSEELFSAIKSDVKETSYKLLATYYLPYQAYYVRMLAKSGFYQSSGAYGFRDQLQDSLAALAFSPKITARQIIRCAAHQYEEGDVQHWWHSGGLGIRSRYSDDCLWLPFAIAEYIEATGDRSILDTKVSYLCSRPLSKKEKERCERAEKSLRRDDIYSHCIRAIEYSLKFGSHSLALFRGGDWNDGMNKVGEAGRGESVWLSWFLILVIEKFIPICLSRSDDEHAKKFERIKEKLSLAIDESAWDGEWYKRGFYDSGAPLGSYDSDECKIDIMAQSFAAFVLGDEEKKERTRTALYSVYDRLFDKRNGLVKLFSPPFENSLEEPGYIKSYPPGIRENGGQYSHAAVWYAMALYEIGDKKRGREVMDALNPIMKCRDAERAKKYRNEPYCMSGDIYTASGEYGRGGWSGYTGSAAWYLRAILKFIGDEDKN